MGPGALRNVRIMFIPRGLLAAFDIQIMVIPKVLPRASFRSIASLVQRRVPITCRGKPIGHEEIFQYNNGHFLVDEEYQYAKRYIRFNIDKLCNLVTSVVGNGISSVSKVDKMEGGFHKALLMTLENGTEIVAKIPCPHAGLPMYSTASEAAVLEFVRTHTTIPVPKVLAWSSDPKNPVGAEYIIMEKAKGVQLHTVWGDLSQSGRLRVIESLVLMEKQLLSFQFPAYGNLYFRHSIPESSCVFLHKDIDSAGLYCVGPAADSAWSNDNVLKKGIESSEFDSGPWVNLKCFGEALIKRSLLKGFPSNARKLSACQPINYGSSSAHKKVLGSAMALVPLISSHPILVANSSPTLLHTDLHMGNIFVTEDGPIEITSIIDWHSITIAPKFIQARWPIVVEPLDGYTRGITPPEPLPDLEQLDSEEKKIAIFTHEQNYLAKAYEVCTARHSLHLHNALEVPQILKEIYIRGGETITDGIFPLRSCLVDLFHYWQDLGFLEPFPIKFTEDEFSHYNKELPLYEEWYTLKEIVKKALNTDSEGWIYPELDWEEKKRLNEELYQLYLNNALAADRTMEETRAMWPFPIE
ncbi:hypothetical protein MaudMau93_002502 [Microsporum audouinii]